MNLGFKACAVIVFGAITLSASTLNFDSVDGVKDSAGNYVAPYNGSLDGTNYLLFCDDFTHNIFIPDSETVNVSAINNLSLTRFGGLAAATSLYEQVFYLSSYLVGASDAQRGDVQDAMWSYFAPSDAPNQSKQAVKDWLTQANNNYASKDYSQFRILTEANSDANPSAQFNGKQELFINISGDSTNTTPTNTPEPGTWALLLTGLGGFVLTRARRQRSAARP
jgi:hypothetical protein